jgi:hypothetical protein
VPAPSYIGNMKLAIYFWKLWYSYVMARWGFLTSHARVLLCIAHDPAARLRDVAARLGITERSAHGIVTDLAEAGYVIKLKDGRRNRYQVQADLPVPGPGSREPAVGEVVALFAAEGRLLPGHAGASYRDSSGSGEPAGPDSEFDAAGAVAG